MRPLFEEGNLLGPSLMQRYLTNVAGIMAFPQITLSKADLPEVWRLPLRALARLCGLSSRSRER